MSDVTLDDAPVGLPNIGNSCWLNSILQVLCRSDAFVNAILQNRDAAPLHGMMANLFDYMDAKDYANIMDAYRKLHMYICTMHPVFRESSQNDCHEVLTYLLNELHKEIAKPVPVEVQESLDATSRAIMRDFNNHVSSLLETALVCVKRTCSDNTVVYETFFTLFVEPTQVELGVYNIQDSLNKMEFVSVPNVIFMTIMMPENAQCKLLFDVVLGDKKYRLSSIVFFIGGVNHYITAVRRKRHSEEEKQGWYVMNDHMCNFVTNEELFSRIRAYPSLICYE